MLTKFSAETKFLVWSSFYNIVMRATSLEKGPDWLKAKVIKTVREGFIWQLFFFHEPISLERVVNELKSVPSTRAGTEELIWLLRDVGLEYNHTLKLFYNNKNELAYMCYESVRQGWEEEKRLRQKQALLQGDTKASSD